MVLDHAPLSGALKTNAPASSPLSQGSQLQQFELPAVHLTSSTAYRGTCTAVTRKNLST